MNLFELLKQFRNIEPDPSYAATSKRALLAQAEVSAGWSARKTLARVIEAGIAVALTGFFILLLSGALSNSALAPVKFSVIDPQNLRAEARAIDIQIELAKLNYVGGASPVSTAKTAQPLAPSPRAMSNAQSSTPGTAPTTASTSVSLDQALEELSN